jgi:hypothetical protein
MIETFKADATQLIIDNTQTLSGGIEWARKIECTNYENGTSVCRHLRVESEGGTAVTRLDLTYTGTPSPWATVKNVESALSGTDDEQGGANRAWGHLSFMVVAFTSFSLGVALVLA